MEQVAPADEAGFSAVIKAAQAGRQPLFVCGHGTKAGMLRPVHAMRAISTRGHTGITLHSPKELVISARAGTPLPEVEAKLAASGQHLIAEPPDLSALLGAGVQTLGGVVATNLSGPRRVAWGAMRDHVIGIRAVNGAGEILHSGGRVLKNVTGLDLCKLLTGSHGTLAVITEITLKVLPAPEAVGTVVVRGVNAARGVAVLSAALGSPFSVSAACWLPRFDGGPAALARIEEFAPSVAYRTGRLRDDLAAFGPAEILDDPASRAIWREVRDAVPLAAGWDDAIWRVSVRPSAGAGVLGAVERAFGAAGFLDWGGGLVWIAGPATEAAHGAVMAAAQAGQGTWTLLRAPDALREAVAVIPPEPPALARIGARVKAAFDPSGILNPGRLHGEV